MEAAAGGREAKTPPSILHVELRVPPINEVFFPSVQTDNTSRTILRKTGSHCPTPEHWEQIYGS